MYGSSSNSNKKVSADKRANQRVKSFMRKIHFENYVRAGMSITDAARRVGVRIPPGRRLKEEDVSKILEKGKW
ncbi:hypothetical protein ACFL25_00395 [Patescibacteria group bacterium]